MKSIKNILLGILAFAAVSCSIENYDIEHNAIFPMGGQYRIISLVDETGEELAGKIANGSRYVFLVNTVNDDADLCWVRIGGYSTNPATAFYGINGKISCDVSDRSNMTFHGKDVENLAANVASSPYTFDVEGVVVEKGATAPSGTVTESIKLTFTNSCFPGKTYTVTGWKYTGWSEDL